MLFRSEIRINPKLNESNLQTIVQETRALIIKLYLTCEVDYVNGLKIYETIVEQKILDTAQNQIKTLENMSDNLINSDNEKKDKKSKKITSDKTKTLSENLEEKSDLNKTVPPVVPPVVPPMAPHMAPPVAPPMAPPMAPSMAPPG